MVSSPGLLRKPATIIEEEASSSALLSESAMAHVVGQWIRREGLTCTRASFPAQDKAPGLEGTVAPDGLPQLSVVAG